MPRTIQPPRWYFSLRSPYSWFAYRDLLARHPNLAERMAWIPFWEPDPPTQVLLDEAGVALPIVPMSREKNFYVLQDTSRLARDRNLVMSWPVDRDPVWEVPHLAYLRAADAGRGRAFIDLAYRDRWERGRDITDPRVIAELGGELGLDTLQLERAADDPRLRERGALILARSARDGLFGVPFFVCGREKFFGVDRLAAFAAAVAAAPTVPAASAAHEVGGLPDAPLPVGVDAGHAGGCG